MAQISCQLMELYQKVPLKRENMLLDHQSHAPSEEAVSN